MLSLNMKICFDNLFFMSLLQMEWNNSTCKIIGKAHRLVKKGFSLNLQQISFHFCKQHFDYKFIYQVSIIVATTLTV